MVNVHAAPGVMHIADPAIRAALDRIAASELLRMTSDW
jgi:hypothetical protein